VKGTDVIVRSALPHDGDTAAIRRRIYPLTNRLIKRNNRLMKPDVSFMSELFRIVNGALRLDIDKVRNYTAFLAEKLEKAGDGASAGRLRKMLEESDQQLRPAGAAFARALPVDDDSRFPLIPHGK
jgi:hypothetical protein